MADSVLWILPYTLQLEAPALLTNLSGDPNTVEGERYIPGSSMWGACAAVWIARQHLGQAAHKDDTFAHLFLRGDLQFLHAYPEVDGKRALPLPFSLRKTKDQDDVWYDAAYDGADLPSDAAERVRSLGLLSTDEGPRQGSGVEAPVQQRLAMHIARSDRLLGRSTNEEGTLFSYHALDGGQRFRGAVLGQQRDLVRLREVVFASEDAVRLRLGRSRSAEYGGQARIQPEACTELRSEALLAGASRPQRVEDGFVVTLTAHLIPNRQEYSGGRLRFPVDELIRRLQAVGVAVPGDGGQFAPTRVFCRSVLVGGFSGVWSLPRPQEEAFEAGSVFVFRIPGVALTDDQAARLAQWPLGRRTCEGFGRFVVNWHGGIRCYERSDPGSRLAPRPQASMPETLKGTVIEAARQWACERVRSQAQQQAERYEKDLDAPQARYLLELIQRFSYDSEDLRQTLREWGERRQKRGLAVPRLAQELSENAPQPQELKTRLGMTEAIPPYLTVLLKEIGYEDLFGEKDQLQALAGAYYRALCEQIFWQKKAREGGRS